MKETAIEKNKKYSEKFIQSTESQEVPKEIKQILIKEKIKSMIDFGCGDGILISAIKKDLDRKSVV